MHGRLELFHELALVRITKRVPTEEKAARRCGKSTTDPDPLTQWDRLRASGLRRPYPAGQSSVRYLWRRPAGRIGIDAVWGTLLGSARAEDDCVPDDGYT